MPEFNVKLLRAGTLCSQRVQAADAAGVATALGVAPEWVLAAEPVAPAGRARGGAGFALRLFSQDLATLLDAGIPLQEALRAMREKERKPAIAATLDRLIDHVNDGHSLSAAFAADPLAFGTLLPAVAAASEHAGQLPATLMLHAEYLAWTASLRARIVAAATYPTLLLAVGGAVVMFLLVFVMPRFAGLLDGSRAEVPWASRALLWAGQLVNQQPGALALVALVLGLLVAAATGSQRVRQRFVALMWRAPWLGQHLRSVGLATLYRTLGMLTGAGVPVFQALELALPVLSVALRPAAAKVARQVVQGQRLSESLDQSGLASAVSRRMVEVGERSGTLPAMLGRAARVHDEEVARVAEFITRVINPVLMLVMGVVIGGIVVLMYLPIFQLVEQVQ